MTSSVYELKFWATAVVVHADGTTDCERCDGTGKITDRTGTPIGDTEPACCLACRGEGRIPYHPEETP